MGARKATCAASSRKNVRAPVLVNDTRLAAPLAPVRSTPAPLSASGRAQMSRRSEVLSLYRALLRGSKLMPTAARAGYVRAKARHEFKAAKGVADPAEVQTLLDYGASSLETVLSQAAHLTRVFNAPESFTDAYQKRRGDDAASRSAT